MSGVCVSEGDIGELGCSQSHHCTGGAVCYQRRCVCPEGYTTTASGTKCAKRGGKRHLDYSFRFSLEFGIIFLWMQSTKITVCVKYLGGFIVSIRQSVREKNDHTVFLQLDDTCYDTRGHKYKLKKYRLQIVTLNIRKYFFSNCYRVVSHWKLNSLPSQSVDADTVLTFKKRLDVCNEWGHSKLVKLL